MGNKILIVSFLFFVWLSGYVKGQSSTENSLAYQVGQKVLEQADVSCAQYNLKTPGLSECIRNARAYFAQERYGIYSD
jgi:hypothetical protein